jgi:hypothetical protein
MEDSVKKIFRDKLRSFLLPDFTNKLTWVFGITGVSLIAVPAAIKLTGKTSFDIFGFNLELEMLSENTTTEGIVLCVFALIQNISYQAYKIIQEKQKDSKNIEYVKKENEILEQKNEYLEAVSAVNVISQIKALKEIHELEVSSLRTEVKSLHTGINNNEAISKLEFKVQEKEAEIASITSTMQMMSESSSVTVGHEFVFGGSSFEFKGGKYIAGIINNIHMHFPLEQVISTLEQVSSNPYAPLSKHFENGKYVLTLNNEGSFKMTLTESELDDLRSNLLNIDADAA